MSTSARLLLRVSFLLIACLSVTPAVFGEIEIDPDGLTDGCVEHPEAEPCSVQPDDEKSESSSVVRIWDRLRGWFENLESLIGGFFRRG